MCTLLFNENALCNFKLMTLWKCLVFSTVTQSISPAHFPFHHLLYPWKKRERCLQSNSLHAIVIGVWNYRIASKITNQSMGTSSEIFKYFSTIYGEISASHFKFYSDLSKKFVDLIFGNLKLFETCSYTTKCI